MKLLIITQKVNKNDPILGFFHNWIKKFASHFEQITVICLEKGEYDLPSNVKVLSLGKEENRSKITYLINFFKYILNERKNYDAVFVHMNPIYIVFGGLIWRLLNKKIYFWYTHKMVDLKLCLSLAFVNQVFTASKESFRLKSRKVLVLGHGIDIDYFYPDSNVIKDQDIVSIGRISSTKNQMIMIQVLKLLKKERDINMAIIGDAITAEDFDYKKNLIKITKDLNLTRSVFFKGNIAPDKIINEYRRSMIVLNLSKTGSLDKTVLEAMASGVKVLTSNEAFFNILPPENISNNDPEEISTKLLRLLNDNVNPNLRDIVVKNHNLTDLIKKISTNIKNESHNFTK